MDQEMMKVLSALDDVVLEKERLDEVNCKCDDQERTLKRKIAEKALQELKSHGGYLSQVEQEQEQEQHRWTKEQLVLLEEAYKKSQKLLKDPKPEWQSENSSIINNMSALQNCLDLQSKDLEMQLQSCNEALAHEEALLDVIKAKDKHIHELRDQVLHVQNTLNRLREKEKNSLHLQQKCRELEEKAFDQVQAELQELQTKFKTISSKCEEAENLEKQYSALENDLNKKQEQLQDLARIHNLLQQQMQQKDKLHSDEIAKIRSSLEEMSSTLSSKKEKETKFQNELDRVHELLEKSQSTAASAEKTVEEYQGQLQSLQQELLMARSSLSQAEAQSKIDKALLDVIKAQDRQIHELKDQVLHVQNTNNRLSEEKNLLDLQQKCGDLEDRRMQDLDSCRVLIGKRETKHEGSVIKGFYKTPRKKNIGEPRRVLVDSKGKEISKNNRQRTPFSKAVNSKSNQVLNTAREEQRTPLTRASANFFTPKSTKVPAMSKHFESFQPRTFAAGNLKEKIPSKVFEEKKQVVTNEKEDTSLKKDDIAAAIVSRTPGPSLRRKKIQRRENLLLTPAMRVEVKDVKSTLSVTSVREKSMQNQSKLQHRSANTKAWQCPK